MLLGISGRKIRDHVALCIVLSAGAIVYVLFPLRIQSMESYSYAAAIERYYHIAKTFTVGLDSTHYPDFGRYHLNHPIGHVLAGWMHDIFGISALKWVSTLNTFSAILAGLFFYAFLLRLRTSKIVASITVALFLVSNSVWISALSGEWHLPALAFELGGLWQITVFWLEEKRKNLFYATLMFAFAACYHMNSLFQTILIAIVVLLTVPIKVRWKDLVIASLAFSVLLFAVYFLIPYLLLGFGSIREYVDTFFIYKELSHLNYRGLDWLTAAVRTIFHAFIFTPTNAKTLDALVLLFFLVIVTLAIQFARSSVLKPVRTAVLLILGLWFTNHWLLGARPDGINGWMSIMPFICLVIMHPVAERQGLAVGFFAIMPALLLCWNFYHVVAVNTFRKAEEIFFFKAPEGISPATPVIFVVDNPVLGFAEIWAAGSLYGFKNQAHFFPRFSSWKQISLLRRTIRENPGFILVSEGPIDQIETILSAEGLQYTKWMDKSARWPEEMIPATIYYKRRAKFQYEKRVTVWIPQKSSAWTR